MFVRKAGWIAASVGMALLAVLVLRIGMTTALAASESASVGAVQAPSVAITHTVGMETAPCDSAQEMVAPGGSDVYFCLTIANSGDVTFTTHYMTRTLQSPTSRRTEYYTLSLTLPPGEIFTLTNDVLTGEFGLPPRFVLPSVESAVGVHVDFRSTNGSDEATATSHARVDVASIELTKTVGTQEGACAAHQTLVAQAGSPLYYCFTIQNTGSVSVAVNLLDDPLFADPLPPFVLPLGVGETAVLTELQPVAGMFVLTATTDTINTATAYATVGSLTISDTATATVRMEAQPINLPIIWSQSAYAAEYAQWRAQKFDSYQFSLQVFCFCPPSPQGVITVEEGEIVSITNAATGAPLPPEEWFFAKTIDELFTILQRAEFDGADVLDADFDPTFGHPIDIYIDYFALVVDDEIRYVVEDFAPLVR